MRLPDDAETWPDHEHHWITDRIAVGSGVWRPGDVARLRTAGITHVVDCRSDARMYAGLYAHSGVRHHHAETLDDGEAKGLDWFAAGATPALAALRRPGTKVLFHCAAGINRGPSMAYFVLRMLGYGPDTSMRMIKSKRQLAHVGYAADAERALVRHRYGG